MEHMYNIRASVDDRVHFAGEYTSLPYYGYVPFPLYLFTSSLRATHRNSHALSYLHGAYYEGEGRGQAIANCITTGKCSFPEGGDFFNDNALYPPNNAEADLYVRGRYEDEDGYTGA